MGRGETCHADINNAISRANVRRCYLYGDLFSGIKDDSLSMNVKQPNRRAQKRLLNDTEDSVDLRRNRFNLFINKYETIDTDYYGNGKNFVFI